MQNISISHLKNNYSKNPVIFLAVSTKIIILEWFLKDHVTLKTGVRMLKIQLWSQE